MNNEIEILNGLLSRLGVKGFLFVRDWDIKGIPYFTIAVSYIESFRCGAPCPGFGIWYDIHDLFGEHGRHTSQDDIKSLINYILVTRKYNSNMQCLVNYFGVNDAGLDFLRCLIDSNSLEELELKLSIMGY